MIWDEKRMEEHKGEFEHLLDGAERLGILKDELRPRRRRTQRVEQSL